MTKKSVPELPIRILKIDTCPTLSGKSQLTYQIGCNDESEVYIRVVQNSGNGQFNADWVLLSVIEKLLIEHPSEKAMTARTIAPLFRGKSSNSPAFLFAALKAETLIGENTDGGWAILGENLEAFKQAMSHLIAAEIDHSEPAKTLKPKRINKEAT
jgi:hypothetical protein